MTRMSVRRLCYALAALAATISLPGCSDSSATPIDVKEAIKKASGGDGSARQSAKAKAASEGAAKKHPKLH